MVIFKKRARVVLTALVLSNPIAAAVENVTSADDQKSSDVASNGLSRADVSKKLAQSIQKEQRMTAKGSFDVELLPQADQDTPAGRMIINKTYHGDLNGAGVGQMISKRTVGGTSVYSAIEEFSGELAGKKGSFTLFHNGVMSAEQTTLSITVVAGSGTDELAGITGECSIEQSDGKHFYTLDYSL